MNATQERWKSVVGYEGYYEVSDHDASDLWTEP